MTKHTPGPWRIQKYRNGQEIRIETQKGFLGGVICLMNEDNNLANAQLIATTPELLEELKDALTNICYLCKRLNPQHENCTSCEDIDRRRRTLNKAEGKEVTP